MTEPHYEYTFGCVWNTRAISIYSQLCVCESIVLVVCVCVCSVWICLNANIVFIWGLISKGDKSWKVFSFDLCQWKKRTEVGLLECIVRTVRNFLPVFPTFLFFFLFKYQIDTIEEVRYIHTMPWNKRANSRFINIHINHLFSIAYGSFVCATHTVPLSVSHTHWF